ncbi:hypothetical protein ACLOJK_026578 [Asimina triloba]
MSITIEQTHADDIQAVYSVNFFDSFILTTVTDTASVVESWISDIYHIHNRRLRHLIVGLDIEWRPTFQSNATSRVAVLQLCVGRRVLIFQLIHADCIPEALSDFLEDSDFRFVGVGIREDVEKLLEDYDLTVTNPVDLRPIAADRYNDQGLRGAGLKRLAIEILGYEVSKPRRVTMSKWDSSWLSFDQVQYACVDAYMSFEIGRRLLSRSTEYGSSYPWPRMGEVHFEKAKNLVIGMMFNTLLLVSDKMGLRPICGSQAWRNKTLQRLLTACGVQAVSLKSIDSMSWHWLICCHKIPRCHKIRLLLPLALSGDQLQSSLATSHDKP